MIPISQSNFASDVVIKHHDHQVTKQFVLIGDKRESHPAVKLLSTNIVLHILWYTYIVVRHYR